jgi:bifunctional non-homologous end joining protein LigD
MPPPAFRPLQLATLVDAVPVGGDWVHEVKYDGYRILLSVGAEAARTYTRSGLDWSDKFAPIIAAAARISTLKLTQAPPRRLDRPRIAVV